MISLPAEDHDNHYNNTCFVYIKDEYARFSKILPSVKAINDPKV